MCLFWFIGDREGEFVFLVLSVRSEYYVFRRCYIIRGFFRGRLGVYEEVERWVF